MQFEIIKASHLPTQEERVFMMVDTLQDLKDVYEMYGKHSVIVNFDEKEIWIYDDYME